MTTLFIVFGVLILAVIGRAILDPPARDQAPSDDRAMAEERARMMETMALSVF